MPIDLHSTLNREYPANIANGDGIGQDAPAAPSDIGQQVTRVLDAVGLEQAGLRPVAQELAMSSRTLERRLAARGLTFNGLVDAYRRERALWLLRNTDSCMDRIAIELGFAGAKNFSRTFRRWYGATPSRVRKTTLPASVLYQGTACGTPAESLQLSHR